jgi:chemotaxis signal transduction protein
MFANNLLNKQAENIDLVQVTLELVVFKIGEVSFGIPMNKIERVINDLFLGEDYTLTQDVQILDLHQLLFGIAISHPNAMAIFSGDLQQLYGIPIDTIPTIISVPLDRIRMLPSEFRTSNPLGIASHIAMISTPPPALTIFILAG